MYCIFMSYIFAPRIFTSCSFVLHYARPAFLAPLVETVQHIRPSESLRFLCYFVLMSTRVRASRRTHTDLGPVQRRLRWVGRRNACRRRPNCPIRRRNRCSRTPTLLHTLCYTVKFTTSMPRWHHSFHDLLLRSYLYHCVWSVITAHNLTPETVSYTHLTLPTILRV